MTPEVSGFNDPSALVRPLDGEQARLVEILGAAGGEPVSFDQFRAQGIENPAMLAYELEIAGFPIAHVHRLQPGGQPTHVGIRLERPWPAPDSEAPQSPCDAAHEKAATAISGASRSAVLAAQAAGAATGRTARAVTARVSGSARHAARRRSSAAVTAATAAPDRTSKAGPDARAGRRRGRAARPVRRGSGDPTRWVFAGGIAALVLIGVIVLVAAGSKPSGNSARDAPGSSAHAQRAATAGAGSASAAAGTHGAGAHKRAAGAHKSSSAKLAVASVPIDRATELQLAGHALLEEGRYAAAISELRSALRAGGESVSGCAEPTTPSCLTYAHALYDLGRALALDNAPAAAHAVLTERLRIDNQRGLVEKQLTLTSHRQHGSSAPTHTSAPSHHQTRPPSHEQPPPEVHHPNPGGVEAPAATADGASHGTSAPEHGSA